MQLDPWPPCLDVGLYCGSKEGSGDAGIEKRWWIIQRKKVRPKKSATSYETVAVLPLAGLCCGSWWKKNDRSFLLALTGGENPESPELNKYQN